jgi:hypothetical protein
MSLHHMLASESPASRRLRWCTPVLLVAGLTAAALLPGLIAGDGPIQRSLCGDLDQVPEACAQLGREAMHELEADLADSVQVDQHPLRFTPRWQADSEGS